MTQQQALERIRSHSKPLEPISADASPRLQRLGDIRAIFFDIYGTLLISASGDIGLGSGDHRARSLAATMRAFDLQLDCSAEAGVQLLEDIIDKEHLAAKTGGTEYPEVEIRETWRSVLAGIVGRDAQERTSEIDVDAFALDYELRVNPTWPMPGVAELLDRLQDSGLVLGVVSNAQFFTPLLFPALLGKSLEDWGVKPALSYFSFEHRQAKPGTYLYAQAAESLASQQIRPEQVLYVGNDMLNDITPAQKVGFRTALFAGDRRSLRWRSEDPRVRNVQPDIVVSHLLQLLDCLNEV